MIDGWKIVTVALAYLGVLFLVAWYADRRARQDPEPARGEGRSGHPVRYALSLAIYCTSWTFFGSVGLAGATGFDFLPVYIGPILLFVLGWPFLVKVVRLAKSQNTTSIADFMAARYGKSQWLAGLVTVVALLGVLPYISLQLKAIAMSLETLIGPSAIGRLPDLPRMLTGDIALTVTALLAIFAVLFGTRHIDTTEHQQGLVVAIATESLVKIVAFVAVGVYVTWTLFGGLTDLGARALADPGIRAIFADGISPAKWFAVTMLSFVCVLLLPRQFHMTVVENTSENEVRRAAWLFPLYLIGINLFVVPIAVAGLLLFPKGTVNADAFVLALPLSQGAHSIAMLAFIGGLSAATAMVIVESVALSVMVCNGIVVPLLLHRQRHLEQTEPAEAGASVGPLLIMIRRVTILVVLGLGYMFYRTVGQPGALASIGLLSFAAIAQLAPSFFGGLYWRRGTARGAIAGIVTGFAVWGYTLFLPWVVRAGWGPREILDSGPWSIGLLRPEAMLGTQIDPLAQGVFWSLLANTLAYVLISLTREPAPIERLQANTFVLNDQPRGVVPAFRLWRTQVTVSDLKKTVARYLGTERTERSFFEYSQARGIELQERAEADIQVLRFSEHLLASAIGAPSARLVLSLLLRRKSVGDQSSLRLLDDASEALQYNRDLLQSALDQVRQGLAVFDRDMRLICWNRQFRELLELPPELGRVGAPIDLILRHLAERGDLGKGNIDDLVEDRVHKLAVTKETFQERRIAGGQRILEVRTSAMPQGGFVVTYLDITERAMASEALERRVRERTQELTEVNKELAEAKSRADEANIAKTRFLVAASHDILQPLNAARLYASTLNELPQADESARLARSIDVSLESVEEILGSLIEMSRLDSGHMLPEFATVSLGELLDQMRVEFTPSARAKGIDLRILTASVHVRSDRRMLRRILQNLISNAVKYTPSGRVLVGCRRRGGSIVLRVYDTGPGIPPDKQSIIFKEFERLPGLPAGVRGLGLGLSIVERMSRVLEQPVVLSSKPGRGTVFSLTLPRVNGMAPAATTPASRSEPEGLPIGDLVALCIDNDPAILEGMRALLTTWKVEVLTAASTEAALDKVRASSLRPDIVLADYHLDGDTGVDTIAAIRRELGRDIDAAIISADASPETLARIRSENLLLLRKPVRAAPLRALLAHASRMRAAAE